MPALLIAAGVGSTVPTTSSSSAGPAGGPARRPNVLIVVTDDQRASEGTLKVMPRTRRWFATGGSRFTRAVSTTPLCCPARASIFSGRYAHNHGVHTNQGKPDFDHRFTIQDYLDDAGYRTAMTGKFFNDWPLRQAPPHFDRYAMFDGGYFNRTYNVNGEMRDVEEYSTTFIKRKTLDFLESFERNGDAKPWLLYVAPYAPHAIFTAAPEHRGDPVPGWNGNPAVFEKDRSDKPDYVRLRDETYKTWKRNRRIQLRSLMSVDELMGGLRNRLRRFDEGRRTIVFYMSDNGYMWADHGLYDKGAPYTPSTRIPMLMRYPAGPKLERRDRRLVGNIDVAPTVLDLAGISPDPLHPMDGTSLVSPDWSRDRILSEYRNSGNVWTPPTWASTHRKRVQYIEYFDSEGNRIFRELYRLKSDPWQLTNVLADGRDGNDPSPARLQALSATLQADRNCSGPSCP